VNARLKIQRRLRGLRKEFVVTRFTIVGRSLDMGGVIECNVALFGGEGKLLWRFRLGEYS